MIKLSIVVPLYKEEENVVHLFGAITSALAPLGEPYEIIFVDDGSPDRTFELASALAAQDTRLKVIRFRANAGQTPAMAAGIDYARGETIITMDGDLQNDPADIPVLLSRIREGYDVVVGWRHNRKDKLITRKIPSVIANWIIGKVTGVPIKDNGCSLKAYRAPVVKNVKLYSDMHRFIPAMMSIAGARVTEVKVRHHPRIHGESKYGLSRIYKVVLDLLVIKTIVSFLARPLVWFAVLAVPPLVVGLSCAMLSFYHYSSSSLLPLPLAATGVVTLALGFFLLLVGVLAELVHKTGDVDVAGLSALTEKRIRLD